MKLKYFFIEFIIRHFVHINNKLHEGRQLLFEKFFVGDAYLRKAKYYVTELCIGMISFYLLHTSIILNGVEKIVRNTFGNWLRIYA